MNETPHPQSSPCPAGSRGLSRATRVSIANRAALPGLLLVIAIVFSFFILRWSWLHGRLSTIPRFDDVGYMHDGALRYLDLKTHGPWSVVVNYFAHAPHSPFSSFMALGGYLFFGIDKNSSPYAMNGILLFIFLLYVCHLLRERPCWQRLAGCAIVLPIPFTGSLVAEFRPDLACALFVGIGVVSALTQEWTRSPLLHRLGIGALFGVAMLTKPSVFPQTGFYFVASMLLGWILDRRTLPDKPTLREFVYSTLFPIGVFVLIALPHFCVSLPYYLDYIYKGMVRERVVWALDISIPEHLWYYLGGFGGAIMLGAHFYRFVALIAVLFYLEWRAPFLGAKRLRFFALAAMILFSYAAPTANAVKTQYFAANFYILLIFTGLLAIFKIVDWAAARSKEAGILLLCMICLDSILLFQFPEKHYERNSPECLARLNTNGQLYAEVKSRTQRPNNPAKVFFYTYAGIVNPLTVDLQFIRDGIMPPKYENADLLYNAGEFPGFLDEADAVVASEANNPEVYNQLPLGKQQKAILEQLRADKRFIETGRVDTVNHNAFIVFDKKK